MSSTPRLRLIQGDITEQQVDVLISAANPWLRMTGGVNGAILSRGGDDVQAELFASLEPSGKFWVPPGTVVRSGPGPLSVRCILHAVAIDGRYLSTTELVATTLRKAFAMAAGEGAGSVAVPPLACGYGNLELIDFARAMAEALPDLSPSITEVRVVLLREDRFRELEGAFHELGLPVAD